MKKVVAEKIGSLDDYAIVDTDRPAPGEGQVLIRVHACSMGYVDALVASGLYQVKPPVPFTPGQEISGTIEETGTGVTHLKAGDRVMASAFGGGLSEYLSVAADAVRTLPAGISFEQASVLGINYLTALTALRDRANIQQGERLLVFGAAGGVGCAAVQLGRLMGANVIAAASTEEKRTFALSQGANDVIDTNEVDWRVRLKQICGGNGPDVIFDPVCGPLFEPAFRSLAWRGRHLVVGFAGGSIPKLPTNLTIMKGASLIGVDVRQLLIFESKHASDLMSQLLKWVGDGSLTPPVGQVFPFADFADAMKFAMSGKGMAKSVIRIST